MGRACGMFVEERNAYRFLVGRAKGRRLLGRYRPRWGIILKVILKE
jgi:hypothetical protein